MTMQATVIKLESWAQQELQAQRTLLGLLGAQQEAINAGTAAGITETGEAIQAHLRSGPARENLRLDLLRRFAREVGVAADTVTLRSIADRADAAGINTEKLHRLREELRNVGAQVLRIGRRIAVMAKYHQGLLAEMLGLLARAGAPNQPEAAYVKDEGGVLLDQEA